MKNGILLESSPAIPPTISPEEIYLSKSNASYSAFTVTSYFENLITSNDFWLPLPTIHHLTSENLLLVLSFLRILHQLTSPSSSGSFTTPVSDDMILPCTTGLLFIPMP